jgi:NADH-quinone oxidoreductase subunit I
VWGTGFFKGMRMTMRNMLRGPITLRYPEERVMLPERARWALQHKYDASGAPKCTACLICVNTCPDGILTLESHKTDDGGKHIDRYVYEIGGCMFCGLCVEACPFDAIEMGKEYEHASTDVRTLYRTLLCDVPAAGPKRRAAEAAAENAELEATADKPEGGDADA